MKQETNKKKGGNKLFTFHNPLLLFCLFTFLPLTVTAANPFDNPDTIVVARDGTGQFRTIGQAIEVCRAFMDYHKVIYIKRGTYKEKLIVPEWLTNIELCGEDRDATIITYDDHANIPMDATLWPTEMSQQLLAMDNRPKLSTFRTFTLHVAGSDITIKNITIENNAAKLGQAVALHTTGDRLQFVNCRILGNQDTVYTCTANTRIYFKDCYIEGTTDFIFGAATAWFEHCDIYCKQDSYITAASTTKEQPFGYVFNDCRITAAPGVTKVYLGRPWRDYGYTLFMNCDLCKEICPEGWHNWEKHREQTARYLEYNNRGAGADTSQRVAWSRQLTKKEAKEITIERVFSMQSTWAPNN